MNMDLDVVHQKAHTRQGEHCRGKNKVDRYAQQRKLVFVGIVKWGKILKGRVVPEEAVEDVV